MATAPSPPAARSAAASQQQVTHLASFGDQNRDGRVDLYALTATAGRHYVGSGMADAPFKPGVTLQHRRTVSAPGSSSKAAYNHSISS
ncbi:hypothetical protein ACIOMM_20445 [Streptomyces sp. NPDC087908]|uniref:hypothetical protein n=1 Tax=Streptomyces sp. NPDC087908 TaxID=3365820 RepID=UPI0037F8B3BD